jgi:predicted CXXCH cytochrome family protein
MTRRVVLGLAVITLLMLSQGAQVAALPDYHTAFVRLYAPKADTALAKARCQLCHTTPEGGRRNPYGEDFGKQNTRDAAAFRAIEKLDSDKDGVSNLDEIRAGTLPGDPTSKPATTAAAAAAPRATPTPASSPQAAPVPSPRAAPQAVAARYVGAETCRMCHADQHRLWTRTRHSRAYGLLETTGQAQNSECLSCHTTGYQRGGFSDATATPGLKGVQCEACHGPGSEHQGGDPRRIVKTPSSAVCAACHKQLNLH